jgi:hypothetical protein
MFVSNCFGQKNHLDKSGIKLSGFICWKHPYKEEYFAALNYGMKGQFKEIAYFLSLA